MLGVIFTGGEGPDSRLIKDQLETETKDALFIAADSGLDAAEEAGIKPDWIIGDMDSIRVKERISSYPAQRVLVYEHDKDFTDTELAFSLAEEKGCNEKWIIGGGGGRTDHLFGIRCLFERDLFPRRWITGAEDIRCIEAGKGEQGSGGELRCNLEKGSIVSVFPLGTEPWEAVSAGLKWPLNKVKWSRGFFGLSNVAVDGFFSVNALNGRFMVIMPLPRIYGE